MVLSFDGENIPFVVQKSSDRRISIRFKRNTTLLEIKTPNGKLDGQTREVLNANKSWIVKNYRSQKVIQSKREEFLKRLRAGKLLFRGSERKLLMIQGEKRWVRFEEEEIHISLSLREREASKEGVVFGALKALAKDYLLKRTKELGKWTQSEFGDIRVKNIKSKWGSCSSKRNLNFNWHLIFLPDPLIDYIIIHELMHLRELNHSPRFWEWVEKYYPGYKKAEKAIREYEWLIGIFDD
ncbi:MAG: M48 family metallopeptidase [Bacteroidia bacterium]|nr:M48 family metallopeptidase [Bacteroidia bacterium]